MEYKYEGNSLKSGIYKITNKLNGRIYIGSAKRFKERWSQHTQSLKRGKHSNKFLQADFNKSGEGAFVFEVIEVTEGKCKEERLLIEEGYLKQYYDKGNKCYNLTKIAHGGFEKAKDELAAKKRRSDALKKRHADPIYKAKQSERMKELWQQPEYRENQVGHMQSQERLEKFYKGCRSPEAMKKMAASKAKYWGKVLSPSGEVYDVTNMSEFCRTHRLCKQSMIPLFQGKVQQANGWRLYSYELVGVAFVRTYSHEKPYCFISPEGILVEGTNLHKLCRLYGLNQGNMYAVLNGKARVCKGWRLPDVVENNKPDE